MNVDPVAYVMRKVMRAAPPWRRRQGQQKIEKIIFVDEISGKEVGVKDRKGYIRLKPVFNFFGARATKAVWHDHLKLLQKVDVVRLGLKYMELGEFIRTLAMKEAGIIDVVG